MVFDPHIFNMALGGSIRGVRSAHEMTQQALALRSGLSLLLIRKYEGGAIRVAPAHLVAIARALGCSVYRLVKDVVGEHGSTKHDAAGLLKAYGAVQSPRDRSALLSFARELAAEESRQAGGA